MFHLIAFIGVILALAGVVEWIRVDAVRGVEARNMAIAAKVQRDSAQQVREQSAEAVAKHRKVARNAEREVRYLQREIDGIKYIQALAGYCKPGCRVSLKAVASKPRVRQ